MILHTTEVIPLPDYRLSLRFNNGEFGTLDLSEELEGEMFEPLKETQPYSPPPTSIRSCALSPGPTVPTWPPSLCSTCSSASARGRHDPRHRRNPYHAASAMGER